ncbi:MAG: T9SS type A sorting domain-containing protein [Aureispira sp.]|nr:T9SS type A sorting domain-containing protein [Aureispira sp.]
MKNLFKLFMLLCLSHLGLNAQVPTLDWALSYGNSSGEHRPSKIAKDAVGNIYVVGNFSVGVVDLDPGLGTANQNSIGSKSVSIQVFDPSGNLINSGALISQTAGTSTASIRGFEMDAAGNLYLAGDFQGDVDFDPTAGTNIISVATPQAVGATDNFVLKLNSSLSLQWVHTYGSFSYDNVSDLAVDASANVFVTGAFYGGADYDPTAGSAPVSSNGGPDFFVQKFDANGNFQWVRTAGAGGFDGASGVATDPSGNVIVTGNFQNTVDFDPGPGTFNLSVTASYEVFTWKLDANGDLVWAIQTTGQTGASNQGRAVETDAVGNIHVLGTLSGSADFDPGPGTDIENSGSTPNADIFIQKISPSGTHMWVSAMGGTASGDYGDNLRIDADGNVYSTGYFGGTADFDPGPGTRNLVAVTFSDAYIQKLDVNGDLVWAYDLGGSQGDDGNGIELGDNSAFYVCGHYSGTTDFDLTTGTFNLTSSGGDDGFITKMTDVCGGTAAKALYWGEPSVGHVEKYEIVTTIQSQVLGTATSAAGVALDSATNTLYWISNSGGTINRQVLPCGTPSVIASGLGSPRDLELDLRNGKVYWTELSTNKVVRANLDGSNPEDILTGVVQPLGLDLDLTNDKIYVALLGGGTSVIISADLDGVGGPTTLASTVDGRDVVTDPANNKMYWTSGSQARIFQADLDGLNPSTFLTGLNQPYGITIDHNAGLLYFTESTPGNIRRISTSGTGLTTVVSGASSPIFIALPSTESPIYTYYVNGNASGANDGSSWTDAFSNLKSATDLAVSGDKIWVAAGTYTPTGGSDRTAAFDIASGVAIYGGFAGTETMLSQRDWSANPTILSGDLGTQGDASDNSYNVVRMQNADAKTTLDGLVIEHGNANGTLYPYNRGGGLSNNGMNSGNSSPTAQNCIFRWNMGTYGGAISNMSNYNGVVDATITGCLFYENTSVWGSAISNGTYQGGSNNSVISNCTFADNVGTSIHNANGGATITIQNSIIWDQGAPLYNYGNETTVQYSLVKSGVFSAGTIDGGNNMFAMDPEFIDAANDNYGLMAFSVGVDMGSNGLLAGAYTTDLLGGARTVNTTVDIGAIERPMAPVIIYVNQAAAGLNNGSDWTNAYTSLQAAIADAATGTSIWVAGGTYLPTGTSDRTMSFQIASGVKIYGGFVGGESQLSQRDWATNPTILSGDIGALGDNTDNSYNVVRMQNVDMTTILDGLIIEQGNANGTPYPYNRGGGLSNNGMYSGNSSPIIQNCIFRWNMGTYGGAISNMSNYNGVVDATITGCLFYENTSATGSAISNGTYQGGSNSSVITNCTFADNTGTSIYNANGNASIIVQNSIIWDAGAPLYNYANEATVQYCILVSGALPAMTIDGGNNMFATDPMFVDAANDDYKLQGASPAVGAGSNAYLPAGYTLDLAYTTRQSGATVEMGCYEDAISSAKTMANNNPTTVNENTSAEEEQAIETVIEEELEMSSLEETTIAINMTVYPNPVQDIVNIRLEGIQETVNLQLLNTAGQTIQQEVLDIQEGQTIQLDMSRLMNGIYLLNVQLEDGTRLNERVIKY